MGPAWLRALVGCAVAGGAIQPAARGQYAPGPPPTGKIELTDGAEKWAHVNDSQEWCDIRVYECEDRDLSCEGVLPGNYYSEAHFHGGTKGYCWPPINTHGTKWFATGLGETVVTARLMDEPSLPGPDANDPDTVITLGQNPVNGHFCGGFKAKVDMNINGAVNASESVEEGLATTVPGGYVSTRYASAGRGTPGADQIDSFIHIGITYGTVPSHAQPRRPIQAAMRYRTSARWWWAVSDSDAADVAGDSMGFSVGPSYYVAGTFNYSWALADYHEGLVAGDWAYFSDGVGAIRNPSGLGPLVFDESGNYAESALPHTGRLVQTMAQMEKSTSGLLARAKGQTSDSAYTINAEVKAVGTDAKDFAMARLFWDDCRFDVLQVTYIAAP